MSNLNLRIHRMSPPRRLVVTALGLLTLGGAGVRVSAQTATPAPAATQPVAEQTLTFDVVSIKRNKLVEAERAALPLGANPVPGRAQTLRGGLLKGQGMSVRELIRDAYGYRNRPQSDIVGAPDWIITERYDVDAKANVNFSASTSVGLPPVGELALRTLLADRFKLKAHVETQRRPIYELVLQRADRRLGPNLVPSKGGCVPFLKREPVNVGLVLDKPAEGQEPVRPCMAAVGTYGITMENTEMSDWAKMLGLRPQLNRTVVDRTGLTGGFDITLRADPEPDLSLLPAIKPLLESEMGLTLRDAEGPVEILVIDHIEHPTEN